MPRLGGLAVVGPIINRHSGLKKRLKSVLLRRGTAHINLLRNQLGLLCQGKKDVEAAAPEIRHNAYATVPRYGADGHSYLKIAARPF